MALSKLFGAKKRKVDSKECVWLRMSEEACVVVFSTQMGNFSFYWAGKNGFLVQIESNQIRL